MSQTPSLKLDQINVQRIFELIDRIIPLETCQHHQILPLGFSTDTPPETLVLGVVHRDEPARMRSLQPYLKTLGRKIRFRNLDSKTHQLLISAYLNYHTAKKQGEALAQSTPSPSDRPRTRHLDVSELKTFIQDQDRPTPEPAAEADPRKHHWRSASRFHVARAQKLPPIKGTPKPLNLTLQHQHLNFNQLGQLSPAHLWQELLGKSIALGVGRLYFQRSRDNNQILISASGKIQGSINGLDHGQFSEVLQGFKDLGRLPAIARNQKQKVEIERFFQGDKILIRVEITPSKYGEEAMIQVLRGKALQYYQQQQMDHLGQEAIALAQKLEYKLKQIYIRRQINAAPLQALATLEEIELNIRKHLTHLHHNPHRGDRP